MRFRHLALLGLMAIILIHTDLQGVFRNQRIASRPLYSIRHITPQGGSMTFSKRLAALAFAIALACLCIVALPQPAQAETSAELQAQLDAAKSKRDELYQQADEISSQLNDTRTQLDEVNGQIDETQAKIDDVQKDISAKEAELKERQATLATTISQNYKTGGVSWLSLIMEATTFDDFVSRVYYADKISQSQADVIEETNRLREELAAKKAELDHEQEQLQQQKSESETLLAQQESQQADLNAKISEADSYVNSLDQQVKDKMAEEAEVARVAAEEAARQAAAEAAANNGNYYRPSSGGSVGSGGGSGTGSGGLTQSQRNTILSAAYSLVGKVNYVWGGENPSTGLDCSGFTRWCYAQAGISLPHSSSSQRALVASHTGLKSVGNLIPGDILCWGGHVGIYAGGNTVIDCNWPPDGVRIATIWNTASSPFYGGGCPV